MRIHVPRDLVEIRPDQILVFGTNATGFHGAGMAGFAFRGVRANTWKSDPVFLRALHSSPGSPDRIGLRAVFGVSRGFMRGSQGWSYGIETIRHPGHRKSTPLAEILDQLLVLGEWARSLHLWTFLCYITGGGYNGWSIEEMHSVYNQWFSLDEPPLNIWIPEEMDPTL